MAWADLAKSQEDVGQGRQRWQVILDERKKESKFVVTSSDAFRAAKGILELTDEANWKDQLDELLKCFPESNINDLSHRIKLILVFADNFVAVDVPKLKEKELTAVIDDAKRAWELPKDSPGSKHLRCHATATFAMALRARYLEAKTPEALNEAVERAEKASDEMPDKLNDEEKLILRQVHAFLYITIWNEYKDSTGPSAKKTQRINETVSRLRAFQKHLPTDEKKQVQEAIDQLNKLIYST